MINIVIFGAPGAGKGTQAQLLAEKYDFLHISTGDLLRQEVALATPLGLRAKAIMNRGDLVGDDIVVTLLARALANRSTLPDPDANIDPWDRERNGEPHRPEGCIIDGFPRTVQQAQTLEFLFSKLKRKIDCIVATNSSDASTSAPPSPAAPTTPRRSSAIASSSTTYKPSPSSTTTASPDSSLPSTAPARSPKPTAASAKPSIWS